MKQSRPVWIQSAFRVFPLFNRQRLTSASNQSLIWNGDSLSRFKYQTFNIGWWSYNPLLWAFNFIHLQDTIESQGAACYLDWPNGRLWFQQENLFSFAFGVPWFSPAATHKQHLKDQVSSEHVCIVFSVCSSWWPVILYEKGGRSTWVPPPPN